METFQKNITIIACIVLIVSLIVLAMFLRNSIKSTQWPPIKSKCPDYWDIDISGTDIKCVNTSTVNECQNRANLDTLADTCDGFTPDLIFAQNAPDNTHNISTDCLKYRWARKAGVTWDGVSNNKEACNDENKNNL